MVWFDNVAQVNNVGFRQSADTRFSHFDCVVELVFSQFNFEFVFLFSLLKVACCLVHTFTTFLAQTSLTLVNILHLVDVRELLLVKLVCVEVVWTVIILFGKRVLVRNDVGGVHLGN